MLPRIRETLKAEQNTAIQQLPQGWHATLFNFRETGQHPDARELQVVEHSLITAFYLCPSASLFCFFLFHFLPDDTEDPTAVVTQLASSFESHNSRPWRPWALFDIAFRLPTAFLLERTKFDIGSKLMVFKWNRRRLYLWHFSCASTFLKDTPPAEWVTGYLNGFSALRGPVFRREDDTVGWRRRRPHFLGHWSEIARGCLRYQIGFKRLAEKNQLVIWVFQYRGKADLERLHRLGEQTSL